MPDKYQRFKDGQLSPEDAETVASELIRRTIQNEYRQHWEQQLKTEHQVFRQSPATNSTKTISTRWRFLLAACLLALLVTVFFWPRQINPQQLANTYLQEAPFPNTLVSRGELATEEALRIQMADAYNLKQYDRVIELGERLNTEGVARSADLFFLGLGYLYQGEQVAPAIPHFQQVIQRSDQFAIESQWFIALAYVHNGQLAEAQTLVQKIVDQQQWPGEKAQTLLEQLKAMSD